MIESKFILLLLLSSTLTHASMSLCVDSKSCINDGINAETFEESLALFRRASEIAMFDEDENVPRATEAVSLAATALLGEERFLDAIDQLLELFFIGEGVEKRDHPLSAFYWVLNTKDLMEQTNTTESFLAIPRLLNAAVTRGIMKDRHQLPYLIMDKRIKGKPVLFPSRKTRKETDFPWMSGLSDNLELMKECLLIVDINDAWVSAGTRHYNRFDDQLVKLGSWEEFIFIDRGVVVEAAQNLCPELTQILEAVEDTDCLVGQTQFSRLKPNSQLVPHNGPTNYRLTAHMGIRIPRKCIDCVGLNVGGRVLEWKKDGQWMVFDDSYSHFAWNRSDKEDRVVFLMNFWHRAAKKNLKQVLDTIDLDGKRAKGLKDEL